MSGVGDKAFSGKVSCSLAAYLSVPLSFSEATAWVVPRRRYPKKYDGMLLGIRGLRVHTTMIKPSPFNPKS